MIFNLTSPVIKSKDHVPVLGEDFTYSGNCQVVDDSVDNVVNWHILFLTTGKLRVMEDSWLIDAFLVGGGARGSAGANGTQSSWDITFGAGGRGGNGGTRKTVSSIVVSPAVDYTITIGGSAGTTSAFSETAASGGGSSGGSGGRGYDSTGSTLNDKKAKNGYSGGQGALAFGEIAGTYYGAGGGGGGGGEVITSTHISRTYGGVGGTTGGGSGGGGCYHSSSTTDHTLSGAFGGSAGAANTGAGGGGGGGGKPTSYSSTGGNPGSGGVGGSGIVIIRKHKEVA